MKIERRRQAEKQSIFQPVFWQQQAAVSTGGGADFISTFV
jgi:hypothetical protein